MKKSDFNYDLPEELIAQTPVEPRNHSRLMKIDRASGEIIHARFYNLCEYLKKGDLLVLNDSRVLPARLYGEKKGTGSFIEFLLLKQRGDKLWEIICRPGKKAREGAEFTFGDGKLSAVVVEVKEDGNRLVKFKCDGNFYSVLDEIGQMPLPPYITKKLEDKERYQTVYSKEIGSSAAPTAGLHFTREMLEEIKAMGVDIAYVTLHVGLGTFRPVKEDDILKHKMHSEYFSVTQDAADRINKAKQEGRRIIAVGTTSVRVLESAVSDGKLQVLSGFTDIFIYPPYKFQMVDALITNFHLPESTLIMLVSAFIGKENTLRMYEYAVKQKYRFFSFGDATLLI